MFAKSDSDFNKIEKKECAAGLALFSLVYLENIEEEKLPARLG